MQPFSINPFLITDCITNACLPPVKPTAGRAREERAGERAPEMTSRGAGQGLSVQETSQRLASVVLGLSGHVCIRRTIEAEIRPRIHVQLDRYSGTAQSIRIGLTERGGRVEVGLLRRPATDCMPARSRCSSSGVSGISPLPATSRKGSRPGSAMFCWRSRTPCA